ncbi:YsnF/AvaK domain-containing protein [Lichenibacterium ramalinae]|uniref:DUF2382 domain-containing protein n=1 Tax=Lichenibacterium ramalinae TaxID=2316527 RepID=A0A4Q2R7L9_9HYPH|nr:YsnF/AvaK domain-containing protein [Lichenibacterium ramalinae]RYB01743.1 DUF2382 domain-containing protein [Lichenibacterium ramalinae]
MSDLPRVSESRTSRVDDRGDIGSAGKPIAATPPSPGVSEDVLQVVEEHLKLDKRRTSVGRVRVHTRTETVDAVAEAELERYRVEVTRVPMDRIVDVVPEARAEGDTTIIPVVEERLVVVKQLVLVEELRIRHVRDREAVRQPVTLRRQRVVVERRDAIGQNRSGDAAPGRDAAVTVVDTASDRPGTPSTPGDGERRSGRDLAIDPSPGREGP